MKSLKLTITVCFLSSLLFNGLNAQLDVEYEWVETTGVFMGSSNAEQTHDVAVDGNNNVYAIGNKGGAINYWNGNFVSSGHKGNSDIWITKFDKDQNFLWNTNIGSSGIDDGYSIDVDADGNVYITGQFQRTSGGCEFGYPNTFTTITLPSSAGYNIGFVAKLNTNGEFQWIKTFEGGTCFPASISVDPNGDVYTTGYFSGTVDFDPGAGTVNLTSTGTTGSDVFVSKLDNNGNYLWARNFGATGSNSVMGRSIVTTATHVYIKGYYEDAVNFRLSGDFVDKTVSGAPTSGFGDYFIAKINSAGTSTNWAYKISRGGTTGYQLAGNTLAISSDGTRLYATGDRSGGIFVTKINNGLSASEDWIKTFGSTSKGQAIAVDGDDNVFFTGNFSGTVDFDPSAATNSLTAIGTSDAFVASLDTDGNYLFAKQFGGTSSSNQGNAIQIGTNGEIYSGGWFTNTTDFDPGTGVENRNSEGSHDLYIHKMHEKSCTSVYGTDTQSACGSLTWIDGNTYTSSNNTATHTIPSGATNGCDSIITLDLTMPGPDASGTDTRTECAPFTWIDGNTYTTNENTATHTILGGAANGCDSIVTLNLTIDGTVDNTTDTRTECAPFTWIDGNTYNSDENAATFTLTNQAGCDSIVTLNLTIAGTSTTGIDTRTECAPFTWIDGNTYNSDENAATFTLTNQAGCDSIVTLNLTIDGTVDNTTDTRTECAPFTWIDGNTYNSDENAAIFTLTNQAGCDSIVTLNLTIDGTVDNTTDTRTECAPFTWIDGNIYNSDENAATFTLTNQAGCDSIVTLNLTINNSTTGTDVQTACGSFTWIDG